MKQKKNPYLHLVGKRVEVTTEGYAVEGLNRTTQVVVLSASEKYLIVLHKPDTLKVRDMIEVAKIASIKEVAV